jgi:hypothetical protein
MIQDGGKILLPPRRGDRQPGQPTVFLGMQKTGGGPGDAG